MHLYDNIHRCTQRFSSYFHQWLTLQAGQQLSHFLLESLLLTHWILIKFIPNSVPLLSFICFLFVPNFKAIILCINKLKHFLQVCEKNNLSHLTQEKNEEKTQKFDHPYLMNDYYKLIKIHWVASPRWQAATMQKSYAFLKGSWSYACVKIVF